METVLWSVHFRPNYHGLNYLFRTVDSDHFTRQSPDWVKNTIKYIGTEREYQMNQNIQSFGTFPVSTNQVFGTEYNLVIESLISSYWDSQSFPATIPVVFGKVCLPSSTRKAVHYDGWVADFGTNEKQTSDSCFASLVELGISLQIGGGVGDVWIAQDSTANPGLSGGLSQCPGTISSCDSE